MDVVERRTIVAGIACALVRIAAVGIPPIARAAGFDPAPLEAPAAALGALGIAGYVVLSGVVLWRVLRHRTRYDWRSLTTYLVAVYFFVPASLSVMFASAVVVAHGLQCMVFLVYHGIGASRLNRAEATRARQKGIRKTLAVLAGLSPLAMLAAWALLGDLTGRVINAPVPSPTPTGFVIDDRKLMSYLTALVTGITVSHYWIDQHLWRFRSPERREWFSRYYTFLGARDGQA